MKRALASIGVLIATLILLELALWFAGTKSKAVRVIVSTGLVQPLLPDAALGVRLNPDIADHDEAGFRNKAVIESPYLIALGDSQTYGTGLPRECAWPQQLGSLSGRTVYNMGVGAYGPVQEMIVLKQGMELHPRVVVEGFYSGNDLFDSYHMVYTRKQVPALRTSDSGVLGAIARAEAERPLEQTVESVFQAYLGNFNHRADLLQSSSALDTARSFLSEHSRLWALLRTAKFVVKQRTSRRVSPDAIWKDQVQMAQRSRGAWIPFESGGVRTVLVPEYRLAVLNMNDPRIHEGLRLSIEAIRRMSRITQPQNVRFMAALIPTKEFVFFAAFRGKLNDVSAPLAELARREEIMWTEVKKELDASGVAYAELLPALRDSLAAGKSPYPESFDGHPNSQGHKVIAAAVWSALTATHE